MLRGCVALAGAQSTLDAWEQGNAPLPSNDGILSARELSRLDLRGTWLVVLSACDTGLGELRNGEGVLGLRRGFVQAGAQNLLMTLWPISDKWSVEIMKSFYEKAMATGNAPQAWQRLVKIQAVRGWQMATELSALIAQECSGRDIDSSQTPTNHGTAEELAEQKVLLDRQATRLEKIVPAEERWQFGL